MAVSQKELKKSRDLVEKLLIVNNQEYNEWLHNQHLQLIEENQDTILMALSAFTTDSNDYKEKTS
ncbi:hypothetical protein [Bacillus sp. JJ722]|uniref:hypothetical protein n=1 Tax=Bacillus sp. JJ722 TaxID=3122973 RepID=UPI002FFF311A